MNEPLLRQSEEIPWSWSMRRSEMFDACERRVFLHYYGARGGHDPDNAPPRVRRLHLQKQLTTPAGYFRDLLARELRRAFYLESGELFANRRYSAFDELAGRLHRTFRRESASMLRGEYRVDHRLPVIDRIYYNVGSPVAVFDEIEELLNRFLASEMTRHNLMRFFAIAPIRRTPLQRPLPIHLGASVFYGAPVLAFRENSSLIFLELCSEEPNTARRDSAVLLHCYHALAAFRMTPDRVISLFWSDRTGETYTPSPGSVNFSEVQDRLAADRMRELALIRDDGTVCESDFAINKQFCNSCNFREDCRHYE